MISFHILAGGIINKKHLMMALLKKTYFILVLQLAALICCNMSAHAADQETVYLQTDRTAYVSGESVYYKMYVLDAAQKNIQTLAKLDILS